MFNLQFRQETNSLINDIYDIWSLHHSLQRWFVTIVNVYLDVSKVNYHRCTKWHLPPNKKEKIGKNNTATRQRAAKFISRSTQYSGAPTKKADLAAEAFGGGIDGGVMRANARCNYALEPRATYLDLGRVSKQKTKEARGHTQGLFPLLSYPPPTAAYLHYILAHKVALPKERRWKAARYVPDWRRRACGCASRGNYGLLLGISPAEYRFTPESCSTQRPSPLLFLRSRVLTLMIMQWWSCCLPITVTIVCCFVGYSICYTFVLL